MQLYETQLIRPQIQREGSLTGAGKEFQGKIITRPIGWGALGPPKSVNILPLPTSRKGKGRGSIWSSNRKI